MRALVRALLRRRAPRGTPLHVVLYERPGCGLCAETHRALARLSTRRRLAIERVDVEGDALLFTRYALRVPVVRLGERELDAAGLDEAALGRWLRETIPAVD